VKPVREFDPSLGIVEREFSTLPRDERPLSVNRRALKRMRIGPIFPSDPDRLVGMRGTPAVGLRRETVPGIVRLKGAVTTGHDWAERRARRRAPAPHRQREPEGEPVIDAVALLGLFAAIAVPLAALADWIEGRERRDARRRNQARRIR
jgi:hypothetical protein